jgi:hypothetical protein
MNCFSSSQQGKILQKQIEKINSSYTMAVWKNNHSAVGGFETALLPESPKHPTRCPHTVAYSRTRSFRLF